MTAMGKCICLCILHQCFWIDWVKQGPYQSINGTDAVNEVLFFSFLGQSSGFCTSGVVI